MSEKNTGRALIGDADCLRAAAAEFAALPVDQEKLAPSDWAPDRYQTTLAKSFSIAGPGTYRGKATRTLRFEQAIDPGWWFDRVDLPDSLPIRVSVNNVWTTVRNIVLCSGSPHNYMRMVEHIVALRLGMGLDNVTIKIESGDPPLFDRSSLDMVEAIEQAGILTQSTPVRYLTVKEPVSACGSNGGFLTFLPCRPGDKPRLRIDCAVDFRSAIGRQRIRFDLTREIFKHGSFARTNTTLGMMLYCFSVGRLFADIRNLGYTRRNILIAGRSKYLNEPRMMVGAKSIEAAWHRAALDLLAAVGLMEEGRFVGEIISYKAGHALDVLMIKQLYKNRLLVPFNS